MARRRLRRPGPCRRRSRGRASAQLIVGFAFERPTDAEQIVATAVQQAEAAGVRQVSGEARAGVPADALIALADGHDVGLVVVSGGRGKKYGLGQVAHRLARPLAT